MKFLFVSDSFKGSLTSKDTSVLLSQALHEVFPNASYQGISVADGGEGTVDALMQACHGKKITCNVHGPRMEELQGYYAQISKEEAVIEMSVASGLTLLKQEAYNPLETTTFGTGELIKDALDQGFRTITIAIGGSATNDGGMGAMCALGVKFYDENMEELAGIGANLSRIHRIDLQGLDARVHQTKFTVMCDVSNPLCGKDGATYTFGRQKGATDAMLVQLEEGMCHYRDLIYNQFHINLDQIAGSGAAGGLGGALFAFLNASFQSGIESVLDLIHFDVLIQDVDCIITGEGRTDWQSSFGKVLQGVGEHAKKYGKVAIAISGSLGEGHSEIYHHGIDSIVTSVDAPMSMQEAIAKARDLYYQAAIRTFRMLRAGMEMERQAKR